MCQPKYCDKQLTSYSEELSKILIEIYSFIQNLVLLPFVSNVLKNSPFCETFKVIHYQLIKILIKMYSFIWNTILLLLFDQFWHNPLRIDEYTDEDTDENKYFWSNTYSYSIMIYLHINVCFYNDQSTCSWQLCLFGIAY